MLSLYFKEGGRKHHTTSIPKEVVVVGPTSDILASRQKTQLGPEGERSSCRLSEQAEAKVLGFNLRLGEIVVPNEKLVGSGKGV